MLSLRFSLPPVNNTCTLSPQHRPLSPNPLLVRRNRHSFRPNPDLSRRLCATAQNVVVEEDDDVGGGRVGIAGAPVEVEPLPAGLQRELLPEHVAVVMDGNRRWARIRGLPSGSGYEAGVRALRGLLELCCRWGIRVLTVFAFSSDNWFRPKVRLVVICLYMCASIYHMVEVDFLMSLLERGIKGELANFMRENIRISIIGDPSKLPEPLQELIIDAEERTKHNAGLQLIVAVSYSGKHDIVQACQSIAVKVNDGLLEPEDINEFLIEQELQTKCTEIPYPDLLIRTSGELRVSNFLLWQLAYTELYFTHSHWPDFGEAEFLEALRSFQQRQRRYGRRDS